jgi:hypothetical protein
MRIFIVSHGVVLAQLPRRTDNWCSLAISANIADDGIGAQSPVFSEPHLSTIPFTPWQVK